MADYAQLLNLDKKPPVQKTKPVSEVSAEKPTGGLTPLAQDPKSSRVQDSLTPRTQEIKEISDRDPKTPRPLDAKTPSTQEVKRPRIIKTHSYEFYTDQVEQIRDMAYEDRKKGGFGSASRLVREAIDEYLQRKGNK